MIRTSSFSSAWSQLSPNRKREALAGYLFISPWLIGFVVFFAGPIIASLFLSFTSWNIVSAPQWVGLKNYVDIFTSDQRFLRAVQVTVTYAIFYLPLEVICGIGLAV